VLVRPEGVRLVAPPAPGIDAGVVEEVEYRGDRIETRIRLGAALVTAVEPSLQRRVRVAVGDRVGVELVEQAVHVIPAETSAPASRAATPAPDPTDTLSRTA
jgi:ABC-type Fe3+/spermidine/putrescine transport system ATPase subunit